MELLSSIRDTAFLLKLPFEEPETKPKAFCQIKTGTLNSPLVKNNLRTADIFVNVLISVILHHIRGNWEWNWARVLFYSF